MENLINTTSLGMAPQEGETPVPKKLLRKGMVVMDIVYEPLQTKLLREAKEKSCLTINGLEDVHSSGGSPIRELDREEARPQTN